jgi:hypothetical protein
MTVGSAIGDNPPRSGNGGQKKIREPVPPGGTVSRCRFDIHFSFAASPGSFKGTTVVSISMGYRRLPFFAPTSAMVEDPIRQGLLKADVTSGLFRLDPLVFEDFFPLRLKFTVERRILQQIIRRR